MRTTAKVNVNDAMTLKKYIYVNVKIIYDWISNILVSNLMCFSLSHVEEIKLVNDYIQTIRLP